jgi:xanthine dehydrogenase molybdopterin-binding subunit B
MEQNLSVSVYRKNKRNIFDFGASVSFQMNGIISTPVAFSIAGNMTRNPIVRIASATHAFLGFAKYFN